VLTDTDTDYPPQVRANMEASEEDKLSDDELVGQVS
jgi:hypothetical protein